MPFYYTREGQQFGPFTEEQLLGFITQGQLGSHELVWADGMASWSPAYTVFKSVPPPPPVPGVAIGPAQPQLAGPPAAAAYAAPGAKERLAYILLGVFLGLLGVHNFYAGYTGRAVTQLLITLLVGWTIVPLLAVAIWNIVEIVTVRTDGSGRAMT